MSRKYEISRCHISYLNYQCIFEFDKNDFACKGHIIILHITLDKTARDSRFFVFKIALYTLSRFPNQPPVQRSCHKLPLELQVYVLPCN